MPPQQIILFDGVCNLCNRSVQYVVKHDPEAIFKFAWLQSDTGKKLMADYQLTSNEMNSFVLIQDGKVYTRSTAALKVAKQLKGFIRVLYIFMIVPAFIRDAVYKLIANNRYHWFGKHDQCMAPTPELKKRFLTD